MPAQGPGKIISLAAMILPENPGPRQAENHRFRQRRSYAGSAAPLARVSRPEGRSYVW
jgi:hypothetical protein